MSSGQSSDQVIKQEIIDNLGISVGKIKLRIFPQSSNFDQLPFSKGGLTFGYQGVYYGSCDAAWILEGLGYIDPYDGSKTNNFPVIALEGTDALQRGSRGDAQYQRFHHVLGAVKGGGIGIYYLRPGKDKIQLDLLRMAYCASKQEAGTYLIVQDLIKVKELLEIIDKYEYGSKQMNDFLIIEIGKMNEIWMKEKFIKNYEGDMKQFAAKRSTIFLDDKTILKYGGRMRRSFTDGSQRSGHIAVGEMFLTKYLFEDKKILYLFPKMTEEDLRYLDVHKKDDKEWKILRHETNVTILTMDNLLGLPGNIRAHLLDITNEPLRGSALRIYNYCVDVIKRLVQEGKIRIRI